MQGKEILKANNGSRRPKHTLNNSRRTSGIPLEASFKLENEQIPFITIVTQNAESEAQDKTLAINNYFLSNSTIAQQNKVESEKIENKNQLFYDLYKEGFREAKNLNSTILEDKEYTMGTQSSFQENKLSSINKENESTSQNKTPTKPPTNPKYSHVEPRYLNATKESLIKPSLGFYYF